MIRKRMTRLAAVTTLAALAATGCGGGGNSSSADGAASGDTLKIGYSAWPGWFPLAVAEQQGFFTKAGLKVELTYFADYTASLDALAAKKIDVNAQTLNDTIFAVAAGSKEQVVVVNDNSTGNDAIICDASITSVKAMKGKTVAAEAGVVDHFLLLQALAKDSMTEKDIDFRGVKTDAAAAAFAKGEFDCVAVFAPFTLQALERPGSKVVASSKDFPGIIPDHLVATSDVVSKRSADMQKLVNAWYATVEWMNANPKEATAIMAKVAEITPEEYASFASGTTIFSAADAVKAFEDRPGDPTSLPEMARRINPFLVSAGIAKKEADLSTLFLSKFTTTYAGQK